MGLVSGLEERDVGGWRGGGDCQTLCSGVSRSERSKEKKKKEKHNQSRVLSQFAVCKIKSFAFFVGRKPLEKDEQS